MSVLLFSIGVVEFILIFNLLRVYYEK